MTLPKGVIAAAALGVLYVSLVLVDHLWFWHNANPDLSGLAFEAGYEGTDVRCEKGVIAVRLDADTARWRCPTLIALEGFSPSRPIVPWPFYRQGESVALRDKLREIMDTAIRPEEQSPMRTRQ